MSHKLEENIDNNGRMLAEAFRSLTYRQFRKMADLIPIKIWMINTNAEIVYIN
jgi:hypothetical protein